MTTTCSGRPSASVAPRLLVDANLARGQLHVLPDYPRVPGATWWLSAVAGQPRSEMVLQVFEWLRAQGNLPA